MIQNVYSYTYRTIYILIFAIVSIAGIYGIGHCMTTSNFDYENVRLYSRDSLIQEMTKFIQPNVKLSKLEKRHIETRIKAFPHRVVRRDTLSYFMNTAYAVAYYEFYKHDYKKGKKWVDEFDKYGMPAGLIPSIFNYTAVGFNARASLDAKRNFKYKKDKNSWWTPLKLSFTDSLNYDNRRSPIQFIDTYLDDIPMDCDISSYTKLLELYKKGGGRLEWLNGYTRPGFVQRCADAGRTDILNTVYELWGVQFADFKINKWGYLEYNNHINHVDSISIAKIKEEILSFDTERNRKQIDSILRSHSSSDIDNKVLTLLYQYYEQSRFVDVVNACEQYGSHVDSSQINTLHDYWGLALSKLGIFEEALKHYDMAIASSTKPDVLSAIRLNKACTLGEMGRTGEAVSIFMSEKGSQKTSFDRFVWNDNLGYIYSFTDPTTALYYYNQAERFLDSGIVYPERKIRHFCRKAQVFGGNKYLQRLSIDEAVKFTLNEFCPDIAKGMAYTELGCFNISAFDYDEADKNFKKAFGLLSSLPKEDRRLSYLNLNYARNLCNLNQYNEAAEVLTKQLHIDDKLYGKHSQEYSKILRQLLLVACQHPVPGLSPDSLHEEYTSLNCNRTSGYRNYDDIMADIVYGLYKDDWAKVKFLFKDALSMELTPMQRLELCRIYENACREHCTPTEYNSAIHEIIPLLKADIISGLLLLTGDEKCAMQTPISELLDGTISMKAYERALELSFFRKGLLFTTRQIVERKLASKRKTKRKYQALVRQREELNSAIEYNDTVHIPKLAFSVSALERNLGQTVSSDKEILKNIDKTLTMVTSALKRYDLAVDFVKYSYNNEPHYGAFIINNGGLVKFVRLGTETELKTDTSQIWKFLHEGFSEYSTVYFSTDGFLNSSCIEYLDFEDGIPVSSIFNLHRVFHLSDIEPATGIGDKIVAIGVSDHNSPVGNGEIIDRGAWTDLPNVKYEMQLIAKTLERLNPRILLNDEVSEQTVDSLSGSKTSTLHISTHGFYKSSDMLKKAAADSLSHDFNIARRFLSSGRSPVSGLVLRQGNLSWQSPEILDEYDDLLTSEEIELMNFPNLQLTVLSACDTGLGDIDQDGVWGLQRAFRIAGSKSLICSLTKVDDYWTSQFMDAFYEHAVQGATIYESFHLAQQWLRHELPDNPEIWSSFILIE